MALDDHWKSHFTVGANAYSSSSSAASLVSTADWYLRLAIAVRRCFWNIGIFVGTHPSLSRSDSFIKR